MRRFSSFPSFLRCVGPCVVTGKADDDPSGIATYTQVRAQFGTGLLWTVFLSLPFMISIQLVSTRIGGVTGEGVAANLGVYTPKAFLTTMVVLLVVANTHQYRRFHPRHRQGAATGGGG